MRWVFVAPSEPPPVGQRVSLHLALPDLDEAHFVDGEVPWVRFTNDRHQAFGGPGMGVKFVKLSLHLAAVLDKLCTLTHSWQERHAIKISPSSPVRRWPLEQ